MKKTKTIAIVNQKGGVGKSTITNSIAKNLIFLYGKKVLVVDFDKQQTLFNKRERDNEKINLQKVEYEEYIKKLKDIDENIDGDIEKEKEKIKLGTNEEIKKRFNFLFLLEKFLKYEKFLKILTPTKNKIDLNPNIDEKFKIKKFPTENIDIFESIQKKYNIIGTDLDEDEQIVKLIKNVEKLKEDNTYDYIMIDTPGSFSQKGLNEIFNLTDFFLIPISDVDADTIDSTEESIISLLHYDFAKVDQNNNVNNLILFFSRLYANKNQKSIINVRNKLKNKEYLNPRTQNLVKIQFTENNVFEDILYNRNEEDTISITNSITPIIKEDLVIFMNELFSKEIL